jgi:hypothetical protein
MANEIERVLERAIGQLREVQTVQGAIAESLRNVSQVVPAARQSTANTGEPAGSALLGLVRPGLLLSPLISGVLKLFGGGDGPSAPPPLLKFALPPAVRVNAGVSNANPGAAFAVDSAQGGLPRAVRERASESGTQQITVNVQAMDSQSFLDRSGDIARAVRQAMLESSVLNDVVREA